MTSAIDSDSLGASESSPGAARDEAMQLGMWILLTGEIAFFGALIAGYALLRWRHPDAVIAASAHTDLLMGTVNTAILLTSSLFMALAVQASESGTNRQVRGRLRMAALLGAVFICIKCLEWHSEWTSHLFPGPSFALSDKPGAELFFAWYFFATAMHAIHLLIGITLTLIFSIKPWAALRSYPRPAALGLYWHFIDAVWILLYPLIYLVAPR